MEVACTEVIATDEIDAVGGVRKFLVLRKTVGVIGATRGVIRVAALVVCMVVIVIAAFALLVAAAATVVVEGIEPRLAVVNNRVGCLVATLVAATAVKVVWADVALVGVVTRLTDVVVIARVIAVALEAAIVVC